MTNSKHHTSVAAAVLLLSLVAVGLGQTLPPYADRLLGRAQAASPPRSPGRAQAPQPRQGLAHNYLKAIKGLWEGMRHGSPAPSASTTTTTTVTTASTAPVSVPISAPPISAPASVPITAPVTAPVSVPTSVPVSVPSASAPAAAVASMPALAPLTAPARVSTPSSPPPRLVPPPIIGVPATYVAHTDEQVWRQVFRKVFAHGQMADRDKLRLQPHETRVGLVILQDVYFAKYWHLMRQGSMANAEQWWTQLNRIASLVRVSQVSPEKCTWRTIREFERLLDNERTRDLNLIPYLEYYRREQLATCKQMANEYVQSEIATQLSPRDLVKLHRLSWHMRDRTAHLLRTAEDPPDEIMNWAVSQALGDYIEELEPDHMMRSQYIRDRGAITPTLTYEFQRLFEIHVVSFCHRVRRTANMALTVHEAEQVYPGLQPETFDWVNNASICDDLLQHSDVFAPAALEHIVSQVDPAAIARSPRSPAAVTTRRQTSTSSTTTSTSATASQPRRSSSPPRYEFLQRHP